jgi:hypothetical protein
MRKSETWLTGLLATAITLALPMAAIASVDCLRPSGFGDGVCDDGTAHLVMGCASILL